MFSLMLFSSSVSMRRMTDFPYIAVLRVTKWRLSNVVITIPVYLPKTKKTCIPTSFYDYLATI